MFYLTGYLNVSALWYNNSMKIIIETNKMSRKKHTQFVKEQTILRNVVHNLQTEIENNPELLETVYTDEFTVGVEIQKRFQDLLSMEKEADAMSGGWRGKLAYKFSKR